MANHPYLFAPEYDIDDKLYRAAGKFVLLRHLIPKMRRFQHRMLIFCQFIGVMDLLGELMDLLGEPYLRIDGGTDSQDRIDSLEVFNERQQEQEQGQEQEGEAWANKYSVFILSTRACGLGLNLYTADTVILLDSDWNPQQDLQAMARCHRIGQTREVRIFRIIADQTIEESIVDRAAKKLDLERKAIECGKFDFSISGAERKDFLKQVLARRVGVDNKYSSDIERKKLNQLLSRSEEEWREFERMDAEEGNGFLALLTDESLPDWLDEITTDKDAVEKLPDKRRRTQVKSYNDLEFWKHIEDKCVEDEEAEVEEDGKKSKKRKMRKRKRGQLEQDAEEEAGSDSGDGKGGKKRRKTVK